MAAKRRVGALRSWLKCKPDFNLQANRIIAVVDRHLISLAGPFRSAAPIAFSMCFLSVPQLLEAIEAVERKESGLGNWTRISCVKKKKKKNARAHIFPHSAPSRLFPDFYC